MIQVQKYYWLFKCKAFYCHRLTRICAIWKTAENIWFYLTNIVESIGLMWKLTLPIWTLCTDRLRLRKNSFLFCVSSRNLVFHSPPHTVNRNIVSMNRPFCGCNNCIGQNLPFFRHTILLYEAVSLRVCSSYYIYPLRCEGRRYWFQ